MEGDKGIWAGDKKQGINKCWPNRPIYSRLSTHSGLAEPS